MADEQATRSRPRRPFPVSIRVKMIAVLTLLILFLLAVAYHSVSWVATRQVEADLRRQLLAVAQATAAGIDGDLHRDLVAGDLPAGRPLDDPRYRELVDWLALVQAATGRAPAGGGLDHRLYLYTYVAGADPGSLVLIGSAGAVEHTPRDALFREPLASPSQTLLAGLQAPVARVDSVVRDRWGVWVTAAAPIRDGAGRPVGAVGVSMRDTAVAALQNRIRASLLPALAAAGAAVLVASLLAAHHVSRPIRQLTAAAEAVAAGEIPQRPGDLALPRPGLISDEIHTLAAAWEAMLARLREREERLADSEQRLLGYTEELRAANLELQETQQQLVHSAQLASIGELATTVAHEINNPLAVVRGLAQILIAEHADDPALHEPLEQIAANTERMARTVKTLRSLGRPATGALEPVLLNPVVADAVALMRAQLADRSIALAADLAPDLPPVQGVAHLLGQVVINLLANARDAILATGRPGSIVVRTARDPQDGSVRLTVTDSGAGIAPADRPHIFRPFFTTKPDGQGTGIGLSISYRIIRQFGGAIHFTSEPGAGTTFTVALPAAELEEPL